MVMLNNRTTKAALFAIAIASSLIVASGGIIGSAFAAKKTSQKSDEGTYTTLSDGKDGVSGPRSNTANLPNSGASHQDSNSNGNSVSKSDLNSLSKCQSGAAADGDLTLSELKHCYTQAVNKGQDKPENSQNSAQANDQAQNGPKQQKSSSLPEPKSTSVREGFNF
jgi:hypothetical protein